MSETTNHSDPGSENQFLYDALKAEGSQDQADLLTGEARAITKQDIIEFLAGRNREKLTDEVEKIFKEIAKRRADSGQKQLPWKDEEIFPFVTAPTTSKSIQISFLYDALVAEGSQDQADLLTGEARTITKQDIIEFLGGENEEKLTEKVEAAFKQISDIRRQKRQKLLPWPDEEIFPYVMQYQGKNIGGGHGRLLLDEPTLKLLCNFKFNTLDLMSNTKVNLKFSIQRQKETNWCWAAVATSCALAYDPDSKWTQCRLASECLGFEETYCGDPGGIDGEHCNIKGCGHQASKKGNKEHPLFLEVNEGKGALNTAEIACGPPIEGAIEFKDIVHEIDAGRLIAFLVCHPVYPNVYSHFVVVSGYRIVDGTAFVTVQNPMHKISIEEYEYTTFTTNYEYQGFVVKQTYLTKGVKSIEKENPDIFFRQPFSSKSVMNSRSVIALAKAIICEVFTTDLEDLLENKGLENAYPVNTLYLQKEENNIVSAYPVDNEITDLTNFQNYWDILLSDCDQSIKQFTHSKELKDLEAALLRIGLLRINALWLRAKNRNNSNYDIFIPLKPSFYGFEAGRPYPTGEFLPKLVEIAEEFAGKPKAN